MRPEDLYLTIINNLNDGVYFADVNRCITFWNTAAENITGYKKEEILGQVCRNTLLSHIDKEGRPLCMMECPLQATNIDGNRRKVEVFIRHKEGHRIPVTVNTFPILENDEIVGSVETFSPISPIVYQDDLIERLTNLAMSDQLTGIANRRKMESYIDYRLRELKRFQRKFCLIFMDIDRFSKFNNTYGHELGDCVLRSVTKSISANTRAIDLFCRWGGEEFVGVYEIKNDCDAAVIADKIRLLVAKTEVQYEGQSLSVTASIGVTIARDDDTVNTIVQRADLLMYESKKKGENCVTSDI